MKITDTPEEFKVDGLDWKSTLSYFLMSMLIIVIGFVLWNIENQKINYYVAKGFCLVLIIVGVGFIGEILSKFLFMRFRLDSRNIEIKCLYWIWKSEGAPVRVRIIKHPFCGSLLKIFFKKGSFEIPTYFTEDIDVFVGAIKARYKAGITIERGSLNRGIVTIVSTEEIPMDTL